MRILVLGGNENQAVACVRSLARAGHSVVVGAHTSWSKAGWSRDCAGTFKYIAPEEDADAFVQCVADEAARKAGTLVLPMTEATTLPLSSQRNRIVDAGGRLVLPSHEAVTRAFDKDETTRLAAGLGLDVPRTVTISNITEARVQARALCYPVVLKPRVSHEYLPNGRVRPTGGPVYARSADDLLRAWSALEHRCHSVIVQEYVEGIGAGYFALLRHGALRAEFAHRRLRDVRPTGSGSALRVSVAPPAAMREQALAVLQALQWHGAAMVEFRLRADGTPVFLEVNGRLWNSLALAVYAGVDFPALLAQLAEHDDVRPVNSYRTGVRSRWLLGDARHLVEVWRGRPAGFPGRFPKRWPTLMSFLLPVPGTYHDNFTLRDPAPELGDWLDFAFHRLTDATERRPREQQEGLAC